jgi:hypothetical protein
MIIQAFVGAQLSNFPQAAPAQIQLRKKTPPMPVASELVIEAAQSWSRLQERKSWFRLRNTNCLLPHALCFKAERNS